MAVFYFPVPGWLKSDFFYNFVLRYLAKQSMPYKKPVIEKIYYPIGEVSEMFQVNTSLIRFWEKEFDIIKPHKNKKGNRLFTKDDIKNLHLIYHLVKERGMTLAGVKKKLHENKEGEQKNFEIVEKLKSIKELLLEVKSELGQEQP